MTPVWVPIVAAFIAAAAAVATAAYTIRAAGKQRALTRQLKIAEFRQAWINDLRDTMVIFSETATDIDKRNEHLGSFVRLQLMMSPNDENYQPLLESISGVNRALIIPTLKIARGVEGAERIEREKIVSAVEEFRRTCQKILNSEWEKLKAELREAEK